MTIKSAVTKTLARLLPSLDSDVCKANLVGKPVGEIFATIYRKKLWGGRLSFGAHSGNGSRNKAVVSPYVSLVRNFLMSLDRPSVVDLGCGDFHVGSQLVDCAGDFIGCDVVDFIVEQNRRRFPSVEFKVVNAIDDNLPEGEVVLVRQVLQHLSNAQVAKIVPKLSQYKYAVITEHVPGFAGFVPNLDMQTGPDQRASFGSGVVLTEPPFNLKSKRDDVLCEVREFGGIIRTIVFEF
jgi:hypothetical protein